VAPETYLAKREILKRVNLRSVHSNKKAKIKALRKWKENSRENASI